MSCLQPNMMKEIFEAGANAISARQGDPYEDLATSIRDASALDSHTGNFITLKRYGFPDTSVGNASVLGVDDTLTQDAQAFLLEYEHFQGDRVTTLTEALRGYLRSVSDIGGVPIDTSTQRVLVFTASLTTEDTLAPPNPETHTFDVIKYGHVRLISFDLRIPASLIADSLNIALLDKLSRKDNNIGDLLRHGEHYLNAAVRYGKIPSLLGDAFGQDGPVFEWAKTLFYSNGSVDSEEHEDAKSEMLKILFGIAVNLAYVSQDNQVGLTILHSMNTESRRETFYSRIGHDFAPSDSFKETVGEYLCLPFEGSVLRSQPDVYDAIQAVIQQGLSINRDNDEYGRIQGHLRAGVLDESFYRALLASLNLANAYRAVAVHEGHEQSLNIIVGRYANLKSLLREYTAFPDDVILPAKGVQREYIEVRAKLKSCCSALRDNSLAILIDPDTYDGMTCRCTHVLKFIRPVFRCLRAKQISDIIQDKERDMALIRVISRSRMELFFMGTCVASWTNADAHWHTTKNWDEKTLRTSLVDLLQCSGRNEERVSKIAEIAVQIAADPTEGGTILLLNDPRFDLGPRKNSENDSSAGDEEYSPYGDAYKCLKDHIEPMTDCLYEGLSYLREINVDIWGDAVIKRLISMDGGTVINLGTGKLWARRKFAGPRTFGCNFRPKESGRDKPLEESWAEKQVHPTRDDILSGKDLTWDSYVKFKEWGTRHQSSLAITGLCLDECARQNAADRPCKKASCPRFVVLTMSSDGDITLMRNGTVITPEKAHKAGLCI